jgi:hypothetical protein
MDAIPLGFAGLAAILYAVVVWGVRSGSASCGDPPAMTRRLTRTIAISGAIWIALVLEVANAGLLRLWTVRPPPSMLFFVAIAVLGVVFARSPAGDRLARGVPLWALVGVHGYRLPLELLMQRAAAAGIMPEQMSYTGLNFDIVTGASALLLAIPLAIWRVPRGVVMGWNVLGLALLWTIVGIGVASTPMFQVFGPDRLNTFIADPPYVLLPAVMVLTAWTGHLVIFRTLATPR